MPEIVTITFNPCIDRTTTVPSLVPGKKLRCTQPTLEPGGGGINVARAICKLGGTATAVYPVGGYTGKYFVELMNRESVPSIAIQTEKETRENIIVVEESSNHQYRFGMPGPELKQTEWTKLLRTIKLLDNSEYIVVSGSLPPNAPAGIYSELSGIVYSSKAKLIVDAPGESLRHALEAGVYLIKPNLGELATLVNKDYLFSHDIAPAAKEIIERYHCQAIAVSMGESGAMLITKDLVVGVTPPSVPRRSTVGAGDSMVAGIVLSLSRGQSLEEAIQFGVACGTAATMNPGTELCRRKDAEALVELIKNPIGHSYIL